MTDTKAKIVHEERSEYFFEYQIHKVFGNEDIDAPKIYVERNYSNESLPYEMFITPKAWLLDDKPDSWRKEKKHEWEGGKLAYDCVKIVYDAKGIDCVFLTDENSAEYQEVELNETYDLNTTKYNLDTFYSKGCKIIIASGDHVQSGVGVISMLKNDQLVARFYFSVNFSFRKKIAYKLKASKNNVDIVFESSDRPDGVKVKLVYADGRLPCLANDTQSEAAWENLALDFQKSSKCCIRCKISKSLNVKSPVFSVKFAGGNNDISKYYILECLENNSLHVDKPGLPIPGNDTCPYCHNKITASPQNARHKKGGIACNGFDPSFSIIEQGDKPFKKCLYCQGDLKDDKGVKQFDPNRLRLLPDDFLHHLHYKIAFTGSNRAGKTTYISRFFEIINNDKDGTTCQMQMSQLVNSLRFFNITISSAPIKLIKNEGNGRYADAKTNWTSSQKEYTDRIISIQPPRYPSATNYDSEGYNLASYPFIAEVNKEAYVSFYDIAGEDAKRSSKIDTLSQGSPIGVFCLINGQKDKGATGSVIQMLNESKIPPNSPVAVIVTKFDTQETAFDSNCFCLRSDYLDEAGKRYSKAPIEWEIDYSSKEIESYLSSESLIDSRAWDKYKNVKFFCVSSFNFNDSIHKENELDINAPGRVRFACSSKRIELPFLWMLKQFNLIK